MLRSTVLIECMYVVWMLDFFGMWQVGTTLTSRPFFGPDHKAIAPSSSFEGRSAPQKVRTASNQCQLVGWWVNWYFRIFRILQVYLPIDQFFDQFSLCSDHLRAFNWPWGTSSCPGWLRRHCIRALLDTQLRSKGSVVFTWHFCHVHSRAIFLLWTTDAHCQQLDQDPVRRQLLIPWLASRRGRWREVLARRAQRKPNILAVHKLCRFCTVLFCCPFCFRSSVIYLSCFFHAFCQAMDGMAAPATSRIRPWRSWPQRFSRKKLMRTRPAGLWSM